MLLCLLKAFTLASSFLLFRKEIRIWVWFLTACCNTDNGPCEISNSSSWRICASSSSDLGMCAYWLSNFQLTGRDKLEQWRTSFFPVWSEGKSLEKVKSWLSRTFMISSQTRVLDVRANSKERWLCQILHWVIIETQARSLASLP